MSSFTIKVCEKTGGGGGAFRSFKPRGRSREVVLYRRPHLGGDELGAARLRGLGLRYQLRLVTTRVNHNTIVYQYRSCTQRRCIVTSTLYTFCCTVLAIQRAGRGCGGASPTTPRSPPRGASPFRPTWRCRPRTPKRRAPPRPTTDWSRQGLTTIL